MSEWVSSLVPVGTPAIRRRTNAGLCCTPFKCTQHSCLFFQITSATTKNNHTVGMQCHLTHALVSPLPYRTTTCHPCLNPTVKAMNHHHSVEPSKSNRQIPFYTFQVLLPRWLLGNCRSQGDQDLYLASPVQTAAQSQLV